jgi:hypothetical protein
VESLPSLKDRDKRGFLKFVDSIRNLTTTAVAFECEPYLCNPKLLGSLVKKLPEIKLASWSIHLRALRLQFPSLMDFAEWLEEAGRQVEGIYDPLEEIKEAVRSENPQQGKKNKVFAAADQPNEKKCLFCKTAGHKVPQCTEFKKASVDDRWIWVKKQKCCFGCLNFGHSFKECKSTRKCGVDECDRNHHQLLHNSRQQPTPNVNPIKFCSGSIINLMVVPVTIIGPKKSVKTYAMLDTGSTMTLLDGSLAEEVGIRGDRKPLNFDGISGADQDSSSQVVQLKISASDGTEFQLTDARTIRKLPLPRQSVRRSTIKKWKHLRNLQIESFEDAVPKILIGQDNLHLTLPSEVRVGPPNSPAAAKTKLGWVLTGRMERNEVSIKSYFIRSEEHDELHEMVKRYFTIESLGVKTVENRRSKEDIRALKIMEKTTRRVGERWETGLLWKEDDIKLPNSRPIAERRLNLMERKMDKDPDFAAAYLKKFVEYNEKGYIRKLTPEEAALITPKTWYLPHFAAFHPNKPGKPRLVFDGAAKAYGKSLNDHLLQGPDLLSPLNNVLCKFRQKKYAFTANIKEMFHQVRMRKEDQGSQRYLWRAMDRDRPPDTYEIPVMFFGATCSPTSAQYVKNRNALEFEKEFPEAAKAITDHHYVDDYLGCTDTVEEAIKLARDVIEVHSKGGFYICNWTSNCRKILESIPVEFRAQEVKELKLAESLPTGRVLGMSWDPEEDQFIWKCNFNKVPEEVISG